MHRIRQEVGIPISGSNGIFDHRDVVEFIMAGAGIVQIGSVLMIKGIKWLPKIIAGINQFMDDHGYPDIASMQGIGSDLAASDYSAQFKKSRMNVQIDHDACNNPTCTVCIQMCFYEALSQADGHIEFHADNCIGCELCYDVCPFDAISMHGTTPEQFAKGYFNIPEGVYEHDKFNTRRNNPESIGRSLLKESA